MTVKKETTKRSMLDNVMQQFNKTADAIHLNSNIRKILSITNNEIILHFPVKMDNGDVEIFTGYRVQHNNALGPYKGGLRYHPTVDVEDAKALAMWMTWKTSLAGLPYGGAKGGIQIDPRDYSIGELERITRRFTYALGENIGPEHDIPAPDVNTNEQTMAWMADTYMSTKSSSERSRNQHVVTGKPVGSGGLEGRNRSTGYGVYLTIKLLYKSSGESLKDKKFIVQGFGNVGSAAAFFLSPMGAKIVGIIDRDGGVINENGFTFEEITTLFRNKNGNQLVADNMMPFEEINEKIWNIGAHIFTPCAASRLVQQSQVDQMIASGLEVISCGANVPFADKEIFFGSIMEHVDSKISLIPDFISNCGMARVFAYLMEKRVEMTDEAIFADTSDRIKGAIAKAHELNSSKTNISATAFEIALKQLV